MSPFDALNSHFESMRNGLLLNHSVTKYFPQAGSWAGNQPGNEDNKFP